MSLSHKNKKQAIKSLKKKVDKFMLLNPTLANR